MAGPDISEYENKYGPWSAHSIEYTPGQYTFGGAEAAAGLKGEADAYRFWFDQFLKKPFAKSRLLDLGCLEGGHSFHLARHGAAVTGLEIRDNNLGHCSFLTETFPDLSLDFVKGDVTKISASSLGEFDGILISGLLYHLDAPDLMPTLGRLKQMTDLLIINTHVAMKAMEYYDDQNYGLRIYGRSLWEHPPERSEDERADKLWSSFANNYSFWPTEHGLINALSRVGFNAVVRLLHPIQPGSTQDRGIWAAMGHSKTAEPMMNLLPDPDPRNHEYGGALGLYLHLPPNPSTKRI